MKHRGKGNFVLCATVFVCVSFFLMLTAITGCGHTHPLAEHKHPHEHDHHHSHQHDHTHEPLEQEPLEEVLHRELVGTYRLESVEQVEQRIRGVERRRSDHGSEKTGKVRGELTIAMDYKFVISAEEEYQYDELEWLEWFDLFGWMPLSVYYGIRPGSSFLIFYYTEGHRLLGRTIPDRTLKYTWDGKVLTLTNIDIEKSFGRDVGSTVTIMKWRKL